MSQATETATVYVVQEDPRKNMLPALRFGSLEVLLNTGEQVLLDARPAVSKMTTRLRHYTEDDFILAVGDPVAIGIACALAARRTGGRLTILKWDRQEGVYYPVNVNLDA